MTNIDDINLILCINFAIGIIFLWLSFYPENLNFLTKRISIGKEIDSTEIDTKTLFSKVILPLAQKLSRKTKNIVKMDVLNKIEVDLLAAGKPFNITALEFYNLKFAYAIIFGVLSIFFALIVDFPIPVCVGMFAGIGMLFPTIWINGLIKKRTIKVEEELPNLLDLIAVCMSSGMNLQRSLTVVCSKNEGLLIDEFKRLQNELLRGAPMIQAFKSLTQRCRSKKILQVYQNIKISETLGTPIADSLQILAESVRKETFEIVKQRAAKAAVMVLFPVLLFIFPAVIIIIIGPAIPALLN